MAVMPPSPYHFQASEAFAECPEEKETREDMHGHPPLLLCLQMSPLLMSELIHMHACPLIAVLHEKKKKKNTGHKQLWTPDRHSGFYF